MAGKRGRPRGYGINRDGVEFALEKAGLTKAELAKAAGIGPGHLADLLHRGTCASLPTVHLLADALGCRPGLLAPELTGWFRFEKPSEESVA